MIKNGHLESTVSGLGSYVKEVVYEFYANLLSEKSEVSSKGVKVFVRNHLYDFSPKVVNKLLGLSPLKKAKLKADAEDDSVSVEKLVELFSAETNIAWGELNLKDIYAHLGALFCIAAFNWIVSSHKNHISEKGLESSTRCFMVYDLTLENWFLIR